MEKIQIKTYDGLFFNINSLFVEYNDIIRSPYFLLLYVFIKNTDIEVPFLDLSIFKDMGDDEIIQWYYARRFQNPFLDLVTDPDATTENLNTFTNNQLLANENLISASPELKFVTVLRNFIDNGSTLVPKIYIWHPYENPAIKEDIDSLFESNIFEVVYGKIEDVIPNIPENSTYVFSDFSNVEVLANLNRLNMESIILPKDYSYNKIGDQYIIDIERYKKEYVCKIDLFYASL